MALQYFDIPVYTYHRALTASSAPENPPLVLIHAFPVDHHVWDATARALTSLLDGSDHDVTVLAVDMPGAGVNPPADADVVGEVAEDGAYTEAMDRLAESIVRAVEGCGYEKAIYAGISMGGYATLSLARQFPDALAGVALCDTKPDADSAEQRARRLAAAELAERDATLAPVLHFAEPKDGDSAFKKSSTFIEQFRAWINAQTPAGIAWRQRMAAGRRDEWDTLRSISAPAAIISGTRDDSAAPDVMRPMAQALVDGGNPHVQFTEILDSGHFTSFEQPEQVARALDELIQTVVREADAPAQRSSHSALQQLQDLRVSEPLRDVPLTLGGVQWNVEKREELGEADWCETLKSPDMHVIFVHNGRVALAKDGMSPSVTTGHQRHLAVVPGSYVSDEVGVYRNALSFLGSVDGQSFVAVDVSRIALKVELIQKAVVQYDWINLREVASLLSARDAQLAAIAVGLERWHSKALYCGYCGARNRLNHAGWAMKCSEIPTHEGFPRIEPSMIVRITDAQDRILLQNNLAWEEGRYSVCSGFVEIGESVEHSVRREVFEELGIHVENVHYLGSQPWPYPGALMLAYEAQAEEGSVHITVDHMEVRDAQWFSRDELMSALARGQVHLPGVDSIALRMIEQWYGATLR
ncbi:hypothetical protein B9G54_05450 [Alloscardovia macacae]|uniref:NAD(+) diphosphatase n=1 Tax=Alloscardovia macacae TaxID=1160091 RepID=A0A1Y2STF6_9BIFI|nr:NAD(+) diphosphatase [Alloscardovia macacae]OTA26255.1 hypothetical protein B9G54_05450 [Alloscardovia macacae]OTA28916.1 hypothetical protein B9T39_05455 [Alloscardovia macacae]